MINLCIIFWTEPKLFSCKILLLGVVISVSLAIVKMCYTVSDSFLMYTHGKDINGRCYIINYLLSELFWHSPASKFQWRSFEYFSVCFHHHNFYKKYLKWILSKIWKTTVRENTWSFVYRTANYVKYQGVNPDNAM